MDKKQKIALFSILGCSVIGGIAYHLHQQDKKKAQIIPDQSLINFLKDLKSQCYPHFFLVADIMQRIKRDAKSEDEENIIISKVMPEIEKLFDKKQQMILAKYDQDIDLILNQIEISKNQQVKLLHSQYFQLYDQSLKGIEPKITLSDKTIKKFTKLELAQIVQQVLEASVIAIGTAMKDIDQNMKVALDDPQFVKRLHQAKLVENKRQVYVQHGVHLDEEEPTSPSEVFSQLSQYHKKQDAEFKKIVSALEDSYEKVIGKLMKKEITLEQALELTKQIQ